MKLVESSPRSPAHLVHLVHEARDVPQARVARLVGVVTPELIVVIDLDALGREALAEGRPRLVGKPRPAVEQQDLQLVTPSELPRVHLEVALRRRDRDHAYAGGVGGDGRNVRRRGLVGTAGEEGTYGGKEEEVSVGTHRRKVAQRATALRHSASRGSASGGPPVTSALPRPLAPVAAPTARTSSPTDVARHRPPNSRPCAPPCYPA